MGNDSLSEAEIGALREIAGTMVPADADLDVPGADDPAILADIVRSVGRDLPLVRKALAEMHRERPIPSPVSAVTGRRP